MTLWKFGVKDTAPVGVSTPSLLIVLTAVCVVPLLFPGDAPFINDEPRLISNAFLANQSHRLAQFGLQGTQGLFYGPLPTWVYQFFLLLSHDLTLLVLLRALLVTAVTAFSLLWLSRTTKLWAWFSIALMLSPYLWFYSRELWDNSFCIPISALAFAAYLAFLDRGSLGSLALVIASLWALTFIHLMSVALTVPIALHIAVTRRRTLWLYKWVALTISLIAVGANYSYCSYLLHSSGGASGHPNIQGWLWPLLAPRYLSTSGLEYFFGSLDHLGVTGITLWLARACWVISLAAFPLVWAGIALAAAEVLRAIRRRRFETRSHAAILALAILAGQVLLNGMTGTYGHPHYYNATWIVFAFFAWLTVDWLAARALATPICTAYASAILATVCLLIAGIRRTGGTRAEGYGATLANQMQVASELSRYPAATPLRLRVLNYVRFPHALATLRLLQAPPAGQLQRPTHLTILYASTEPMNARIKLVED